MANCTAVIKLAMRKLQLIASAAAPTSTEGADYLILLEDMYRSWIEIGVFGFLTDVIATANYEAKENERIRADGFSVTRPLTLVDTTTGLSRAPKDMALVVIVTAGQEPARHIYDANRGEWVALNGLTLNGEAPLSQRGLDGLACCLAVHIADENGSAVPDATALGQRSFRNRLASRKSAERADVQVEYF